MAPIVKSSVDSHGNGEEAITPVGGGVAQVDALVQLETGKEERGIAHYTRANAAAVMEGTEGTTSSLVAAEPKEPAVEKKGSLLQMEQRWLLKTMKQTLKR